MKKYLVSLGIVLWVVLLSAVVQAEIIWSEDFSDVSNWGIISDVGGSSSITASSGLGTMYVDKGDSIAAFGPNQIDANLVPFDLTKKSEYTLSWKVADITWSVSWDIAIDEFDADKKYINTIWNLYPAMGSTAEKGEFSKNLSDKTWSINTRYIIPKINIHTGDPKQTVRFDYIKVEQSTKKRY